MPLYVRARVRRGSGACATRSPRRHRKKAHNTKHTTNKQPQHTQKVEGLPVYGVAIPTVRGLRNALDALGAANGARRVLWHNMREEPVVYINGRPYVVREADQPFCNLEYTGR